MSQDYPEDWDQRRKRVYKRDNYKCRICGARGGWRGDTELHAHHKTPKSKGGSHRMRNLKTVCKDCHKEIHGSGPPPISRSNKHEPDLDDEEAGPIVGFLIIVFGAVIFASFLPRDFVNNVLDHFIEILIIWLFLFILVSIVEYKRGNFL